MEKEDALKIDLSINRLILTVLISCFVFEAIIIFLDILYNLGIVWYFEKFRRVCNIDEEKSFGTWFSVVLNFTVAITALIISLHYQYIFRQKGKFFGWLLIFLFFGYISLDDHLMLHENLGSVVPVFFQWIFGKSVTLPTYGWFFSFAPIFGAFGIFFLIFLFKQLDQKKYKFFLILGLFLWVLAASLDAWDGIKHAYDWLIQMTGFKEFYIRKFFMLIEEMSEMLGSTLFLYLFLSHIKSLYTKQETLFKFSK